MPLPKMVGEAPMQFMDDDCLTAQAIDRLAEEQRKMCVLMAELISIQKKAYELELADAKKEAKPEKKCKKVTTIKRDSEGFITSTITTE